jgi:hypothetical protein
MLFGGLFSIGLVAMMGGFLHYRRDRLLTHKERLKALELGREFPDDAGTAQIKAAFGVSSNGKKTDPNEGTDGSRAALSRKAFSTALWVAFWGFVAASQSGSMPGHPSAGIAISIAIAASAAAIGVTAAICGTILALCTPNSPASSASAKPAIESDALDVVSRRG